MSTSLNAKWSTIPDHQLLSYRLMLETDFLLMQGLSDSKASGTYFQFLILGKVLILNASFMVYGVQAISSPKPLILQFPRKQTSIFIQTFKINDSMVDHTCVAG